jgi:hypothetical protein
VVIPGVWQLAEVSCRVVGADDPGLLAAMGDGDGATTVRHWRSSWPPQRGPSPLGYQPGIAALAAGVLSPIATLILVLLTLFGALPIYRRVARESPHGAGSISMLERLLPWWQGKLFVLVLLGFVATDFVITITLSAADATAHVLQNPFVPDFLEGQAVPVTLLLIALLGGVFLRGFAEAIGIAVGVVAIYLALNLVVVAVALMHVLGNPGIVADWRNLLVTR